MNFWLMLMVAGVLPFFFRLESSEVKSLGLWLVGGRLRMSYSFGVAPNHLRKLSFVQGFLEEQIVLGRHFQW